MRILVFLSGMIAIVLVACSSPVPIQNEATPDIDATVEARAKELVAAQDANKPTSTEVVTQQPTVIPTPLPTQQPTVTPTPLPTQQPTVIPTPLPTQQPTVTPTPLPTQQPTVTPTPPPFTGLWNYSNNIDTMTDAVRHYLMNTAVSGEGKFGDSIILGVTCFPPDVMVSIGWQSFIGLDSTEVTWRWDSEDAISGEWTLGADGTMTALFEWGAVWFVKDMLKSNQLIARVSPYSGPMLTATFDLGGLEEATKPLYEECPSLKPTALPTPTPAPTPTKKPSTPTPRPTATPEPSRATSFGDGTWVVGADILHGTYRSSRTGGGCYWKRLSGFSGGFDDIIANELTDELSLVEISSTDAGFSTEDCGTWKKATTRITSSLTSAFGNGTFIVGLDIASGTWRSPGGDSCYWKRLSGFSGEFKHIEANNLGESNNIVTIQSTDKGFSSSDCGSWTKQ